MSTRLHPGNPAEAVIAPFFDRALSPEDEWLLEPAPGTVGLVRHHLVTRLEIQPL